MRAARREGLALPLKMAYGSTNAAVLNPLLANDGGRDPAFGYDALEARAPTAEELLGAQAAVDGDDGLDPETPEADAEAQAPSGSAKRAKSMSHC